MQSKKSILVVEDDKSTQKIYEHMLKGKYKIDIVGDTKNAKKKIDKKKYDLVLLDIILPEESGDTFFVNTKLNPRFKDLKIIIVTVLGDVSYNLKKVDPDIICIGKPFKKDELLETIDKRINE